MDLKTSVFGVIGLVVAIIIIATLAIPALTDASMEREYATQNGSGSFDLGTFSYEYADSVLTVGDAALTPVGKNIFASESVKLQVFNTSAYVFTYMNEGTAEAVTLGAAWTAELASDGTLTVVNDGTTYTTTTTPGNTIHQVVSGGKYVGLPSGGAYANNGIKAYFVGSNSTTSIIWASSNLASSGSVLGSLNVSGDIVVSWDATTSDGKTLVANPTFTFNAGSPVALDAFVAAEYYTLVEGTGTNALLIGVIPMLLFIIPVMMAVRMIAGRE